MRRADIDGDGAERIARRGVVWEPNAVLAVLCDSAGGNVRWGMETPRRMEDEGWRMEDGGGTEEDSISGRHSFQSFSGKAPVGCCCIQRGTRHG